MFDVFKNDKNDLGRWIFIIAAVAIILLFVTWARNRNMNNTLEVYTDSNVVEGEEEETDDAADYDSVIVTYPEGFSLSIPSDWTRVTKSGFDTYVHAATGSSFQIQISDYDPEINNISAQEVSNEVTENGMTFFSFTRETSSSYIAEYQDYKNSTYDYIEEVFWDRGTIIKFVCTFDDAYYTDIISYYEFILNSFVWDRADPIPEDLVLWYLETGDFEFAYPLDWNVSEADGAISATNETSTAYMTVTLSEYNDSLENITGSELTNLIGTGKSNFMLNSYDASSAKVTAQATYVSGGTQYTNKTYLFTNGAYLYDISFDYEAGTIEDTLPDECAGLFREFYSEAVIREATEGMTDAELYEYYKDSDEDAESVEADATSNN